VRPLQKTLLPLTVGAFIADSSKDRAVLFEVQAAVAILSFKRSFAIATIEVIATVGISNN